MTTRQPLPPELLAELDNRAQVAMDAAREVFALPRSMPTGAPEREAAMAKFNAATKLVDETEAKIRALLNLT